MTTIKSLILHENGSITLGEANTSCTKIRRETAHWTQLCQATFYTGKYNLFLSPAKYLVYVQKQETEFSLSELKIAELLFTFACLRKKKKNHQKKRNKKIKEKRKGKKKPRELFLKTKSKQHSSSSILFNVCWLHKPWKLLSTWEE